MAKAKSPKSCPMFFRPKRVRGRLICRTILNAQERNYLHKLEAKRAK